MSEERPREHKMLPISVSNNVSANRVSGRYDLSLQVRAEVALKEPELAALREAVSIFGAEIIRAEAAARRASFEADSFAAEARDATIQDLSVKVSELKAMLQQAVYKS
jgi:hypothetical protein